MRVALLGQVDSGKTSLCTLLAGKKSKETYGRTETLQFYPVNSYFTLVDSPGHWGLTPTRQDAVKMADLVLYLVDSTNPNYHTLPLLKDIPYIILLNKWDLVHPEDVTRPLKQIISRPTDKIYDKLSKYIDQISNQQGIIAHPFLDINSLEEISHSVCPISAHKKWGKELLLNLIKIYSSHLKDKKRFLYKVSETTYRPVGDISPRSVVSCGIRVQDHFILKRGFYYLKEGVNYESSVLGVDGSTPHTLTLESIKCKNLEKLTKTWDLESVYIYCIKEQDWKNLSFYVKNQGLNPIRINRHSSDLQRSNPSGLTLSICGHRQSIITTQPLRVFLSSDSPIDLMVSLSKIPEEFEKLHLEEKKRKFHHSCVLVNDPSYVFLNQKFLKILGVKLLHGTLKSGCILDLYSQSYKKLGKCTVLSIKDKEKTLSCWDKTNHYVAIKLRTEQDISFEEKRYLVSPILIKDLEQYSTLTRIDQDTLDLLQSVKVS